MEQPQRIKCCNVSFKFLRLCKMFPEEGQENSFKYIIPVLGILMDTLITFTFTMLFVITNLKNYLGLEVSTFGIVCMVSTFGVTWINGFCFKNRHILISLAEALSDFEKFGKPPAFDEANERINFFSKLHLIYLTGGSMAYFAIFAPIQKHHCISMNIEKNLTSPCSLFLPMYVPYVKSDDLEKSPTIYIINSLQFALILCIYTTCGTVVWNNFEIVEHIRIRIRHLKSIMLSAFKETDVTVRRRTFRPALEYHAEIFRLCKMFPEEGQENSFKYIIPVLGILMDTLITFTFTMLFVITNLKNYLGLEVSTFGIVCMVSTFGVTWINGFCFKNRHILISLAEALSDFEKFGKPPAFDEANERINFFSKLHLIYLTGGSMAYFAIFAPIQKHHCISMNIEKNLTSPCSLFLPMYVPYVKSDDLEKSPTIYIINSLQFALILCIYTTCGTVVWNNFEIVEHIRIRIRHLKSIMLSAFKETDVTVRRRTFRPALEYHAEIFRMARLADKFFGTELFLHVILTGVILGVSAFVMFANREVAILMIFVGWLNAVIIGCVSGQRLINESETIPGVLYEVDWYNLENDFKKDTVFFLERCKKPMHIRAGNVIMNNRLIMELIDQERKLSIVCSRTMAAMSLGFIVLVTPWTIQEVVAACTGSRAPPALDFVATWMSLSNSFWYPFIYWTLNNHFRRTCREIFSGVCCQKSQEKKKQFEHFCNTSPSSNYLGHTPDCDLEGLSEKYWGEILERTVSTSSLHGPQQNPPDTRLDCNGGIELNLLNNSVSDL